MVVKYALIFLSAALIIGEHISSFYGPFDVVFHRLEKCEGSLAESKMFSLNPMRLIRDRRNPRAWWYNGTVSFGEDVSDKIYMETRVASWGTRGGWVENAFIYKADNICKKGKAWIPKSLIQNASAAIGHPELQDCPIPKGEYKVENLYTDLEFSKYFPPLPYGKFKAECKYARDKKSPFEGCIKLYVDLVPKPGGQPGLLNFQQIS